MDHVPVDIHGYRNIEYSKNTIGRLLWLFLILAGLALALWWSIESLSRYLASPISVNILTETETEMEMPEVEFCPTKSLNFTAMRKAGYSEKLIAFVDGYFRIFRPNLQDPTELISSMVDNEAEQLFESFVDKNMSNFDGLMLKYGIQCRQFLRTCILGGVEFNCCEYATAVIHGMYGACFILRNLSAVAAQTENGGPVAGLQVLLEVNLPSAGSVPTQIGTYVDVGSSFVVNRNFTLVISDATTIPRQQAAFVEMQPFLYRRSPKRTGGCVTASSTNLGMGVCGIACWTMRYKDFCNCSEPGMKLAYSATPEIFEPECTPQQFFVCMLSYSTIYKSYQQCLTQNCLVPVCKEWQYKVKVSYGDLSSISTSQISALSNENAEIFSMAFFYYSQLAYTVIEEYDVVSFDGLVGAVGGNFGLFMGASFISLIQFLWALFHHSWHFSINVNKNWLKKKNNINNALQQPITEKGKMEENESRIKGVINPDNMSL